MSMMILVAGPFRSGTNGDEAKRAKNMEALNQAALDLWHRGHLPVIGEWVTIPLAKAAGSVAIGDAVWDSLGYPAADRLIDRCDAVLRLPGDSVGADGDVARARERGLVVYSSIDEVPLGHPAPGRG